ncbi:MAG: M48 family metalloprotease [Actinomycetota bacterium]
MYEQIAANKRRSILLVGSFVLLLGALGWLIGELNGYGWIAAAIALGFAGFLSWGSFYWSDRIVLGMTRAVPADPQVHARLHNIVEGLSIAAGIPKARVYVVTDPAPNAFATGRNPEHAAVAVTTGLLEKMNRVELEGVMAHELSHVRNHDILVTTIAVTLAGAVALLADWFLRAMWWGGRRRDDRGGGNPLALVLVVVGALLALLSPLIAQLIKAAVSRGRELLADVSGVELTRYPPGLIAALKKLRDDRTVVATASHATAHLWIESPLDREGAGLGSRLNRLFDTHPPLEERIRHLETL